MKIPRIMLSAGASGSGKTLITCGVLQALKNRGHRVASFKCGPDYIDPMFHTKVIGTHSRNLDTFFSDEKTIRYLLCENNRDMDIAVMEGVMGYYDGVGGTTTKASAYDLACVSETPVILIVNSKGMSVSIVPYIKGFLEYKKDSRIRGVILNQMNGMLYPRIKELIERELDIKVCGYVPKVEDCVLESRHLGLVLPDEVEGLRENLAALADIMKDTIDFDMIEEIADSAAELDGTKPWDEDSTYNFKLPEKVKIGVATDEAFCFIYEDNIRLLTKMGAEIVRFSPLHDEKIPEGINGMVLYGGYPELFAKELEENKSMRESVKAAFDNGMPLIAECGGFMYLHDSLEGMDGETRKGAGVIKGHTYRTPRLSRFGYINTYREEGTVFGKDIGTSPAHEFHYFDSENCGEDFVCRKPEGKRNWKALHAGDNYLMGFPHFYYYGNPELPKAFLLKCEEYMNR